MAQHSLAVQNRGLKHRFIQFHNQITNNYNNNDIEPDFTMFTLQNTYKQYDKDQSGHFNSCELREALKAVGKNTQIHKART